MEKQSKSQIQVSRISKIKSSLSDFYNRKSQWSEDLEEIVSLVYNSGDFVIARLRDKINGTDDHWFISESGIISVHDIYEGFLPDLDLLADLICESLKNKMEKQTVTGKKESNLTRIDHAISTLQLKRDVWMSRLNEIITLISHSDEFAIARIRCEINENSTTWIVDYDGNIYTSDDVKGYLPSINDLIDLICDALK